MASRSGSRKTRVQELVGKSPGLVRNSPGLVKNSPGLVKNSPGLLRFARHGHNLMGESPERAPIAGSA